MATSASLRSLAPVRVDSLGEVPAASACAAAADVAPDAMESSELESAARGVASLAVSAGLASPRSGECTVGAADAAVAPPPWEAGCADLVAHRIAFEFTAHEAIYDMEGAHALAQRLPRGVECKNLLFKDSGKQLYVVLLPEHKSADLKGLVAQLGAKKKLAFAKPDDMRAALGVEPGAAGVVSLLRRDVTSATPVVAIDRALLHTRTHHHPMTNLATVTLNTDDLIAALTACGVRVVEIGEPRD